MRRGMRAHDQRSALRWRITAGCAAALVLSCAGVTLGGGDSAAQEKPQSAIEELINFPFADKDDMTAVRLAARLLKVAAASDVGRDSDADRLQAVKGFLDEVMAFTDTSTRDGERYQIVDFRRSKDKAVRRLREDVRLPAPEGGAIVRVYESKRDMPPPIRALFKTGMKGVTRGCRFVAVSEDDSPAVLIEDTISHELAHAYVLSTLGMDGDKLPRWFHEGVALYISEGRDQYLSRPGFGERRVEFSPKDYNEYRLTFRYLHSKIGKEGVESFIREAIEQRSAEKPLRSLTGIGSYAALAVNARRWHGRRQATGALLGLLALGVLLALLRRVARKARERRVDEASGEFYDAADAAGAHAEEAATRLRLLLDEGADMETLADDEVLAGDIEAIAFDLIKQAQAFLKVGRRDQARARLEQALRMAPDSPRVTAAVQAVVDAMRGIYT